MWPYLRPRQGIIRSYRELSDAHKMKPVSTLRVSYRLKVKLRVTVNIWSHGVGTLLYSAIPLYLYDASRHHYEHLPNQDLLKLFIFFASVTVCFTFS